MMTTPTRDFLHRRRRSLRQALAVIPDITSLSVSPGSPLPTDVNTINNRYSRDSWSPAPSPDELVIQKRGRRSKSIVWSPEADAKRDSLLSLSLRDRTPVKSPTKASSHLKSTPRKRLLLDDNDDMTPDKSKVERDGQRQFTGSLMNGLRGLSNEQLVKVIMDLVSMQEDGALSLNDKLRDIVINRIPVADVQPLRERLSALRQNVSASLMSFERMDEFSYNRAFIHLETFQKTLMEQGSKLIDSQHWTAAMQYVLLAWPITKDLPECPLPDNTTQKCFQSLTQICKVALMNGNFVNSTLQMFADRMETMIHDCDEMRICHQMAKEMMRP
ncbi:uncharacterized protein LOC107036300 [Diachasma alloeum]|uniref:uncharacterized protein LOC107036300 n=1 Tax=Diachasma alloeum TaxID=454923 RepID=UPI000738270D|nr:uncharacterized protein LOC107036300 [Diachasma alloeum]